METSEILVSNEGVVRTLTLNRPAALNAFTSTMLCSLHAAFADAAADKSVRCVVLTGAGRAFSAGQDLSDPAAAPEGDTLKDIGRLIDENYRPLALAIRAMPVPVIAAVNGVAAGAAANLAFGCDLVLAAQSASFIQAFSKIGLVPDAGGCWLLPRLVGRARALELALLGEKLPAAQAQQMGLIYRSVPDEELPSAAQALAQKLAQMPVGALAATRQAFDEASQLGFADALAMEARVQRECGFSDDFREGVNAFLQKRKPQFTGR